MSLKGRVVIVTGGASGIGKAISEKMANEKAAVVIADIDLEQAKNLEGTITKMGSKALAVGMDVTKSAHIV